MVSSGTLLDVGSLDARRDRLLHALLVLLALFTGASVVGRLAVRAPPFYNLVDVATLLLLGAAYTAQRRGRRSLAVNLFLLQLAASSIAWAFLSRSAIPTLYYFGVVVVAASTFGRPRAALLWAGGLTIAAVVINLVLYAAPLPLSSAVDFATPEGWPIPPPVVLHLSGLAIMWMLAGAAFLTSRMLFQALGESQAAAERVAESQALLERRQIELASQNTQLVEVRQHLEQVVAALTVPVVPVARQVGLLALVGPLDTARLRAIESGALRSAGEQRLAALVIDLSGVSELPEEAVGALVRLCGALQLLGVAVRLSGLGAGGALLLSGRSASLPPASRTVEEALQSVGVSRES